MRGVGPSGLGKDLRREIDRDIQRKGLDAFLLSSSGRHFEFDIVVYIPSWP